MWGSELNILSKQLHSDRRFGGKITNLYCTAKQANRKILLSVVEAGAAIVVGALIIGAFKYDVAGLMLNVAIEEGEISFA